MTNKEIKQKSINLGKVSPERFYVEQLAEKGILDKNKVANYIQLCERFDEIAKPVDHCDKRKGYNKGISKIENRISLITMSVVSASAAIGLPLVTYIKHTKARFVDPFSFSEVIGCATVGLIAGCCLIGLPACLITEKISQKLRKKNPEEFAKDYDNSVYALNGYAHEIRRQSLELVEGMKGYRVSEIEEKTNLSAFTSTFSSLESNQALEIKVQYIADHVGGNK